MSMLLLLCCAFTGGGGVCIEAEYHHQVAYAGQSYGHQNGAREGRRDRSHPPSVIAPKPVLALVGAVAQLRLLMRRRSSLANM
jgi:hypothetical protein